MPEPLKTIVTPAQEQTALSRDEVLNSGSAGVIIHRTGQLKHEFRSKGRDFARQIAEYTNTSQRGKATVFLYEEQFGTQDRLHWLIHMPHLTQYEDLIQMGDEDDAFRDDTFSSMFVDGTIQDEVLIPHHPGMHGQNSQSN